MIAGKEARSVFGFVFGFQLSVFGRFAGRKLKTE